MSLYERYTEKEIPRLNRLNEYYLGNADIKKRTMNDPNKPNNKIASPYASMITDTVTGYGMGKPIAYSAEDKELMLAVQAVFDKNHEQSHNKKLWKQLTITGLSYELLFLDEDGNICFAPIDPRNCFFIYDNSVKENVLMAVIPSVEQDYINEEEKIIFTCYTSELISTYEMNDTSLTLVDEELHSFGAVPVIQYKNNDEYTGAFEKVIDLIDAYDTAVSDTINNLEYFSDSYLVLENAEFEDDSEVATMKENRVLILPESSKAYWLTKEGSEESEQTKNRLKEDIHVLSQIPNLGDESFGNTTSGESLKYKLFGLENLVSITEGNFKESIETRIKLITNILNIKRTDSYDYTYITLSFTRNIPTNMANVADVVSKLVGIISNETLYTLMPFVDDPALELEKVARESEASDYDEFHSQMNTDTHEPIIE